MAKGKELQYYVIELQGSGMTLIKATSQEAAERRARQYIIDYFLGSVHLASDSEIAGFKAMGGAMP